MDPVTLYQARRPRTRPANNWNLAWILACEIARRFYASHGVVPHVIDHEGSGYYGIRLDLAPCHVHGLHTEPLGRVTAHGNVENWRTGSPGDHGLELVVRADRGDSLDSLVAAAISHLQLSGQPPKSHVDCRHKRWGGSWVLLFEIATILALRHHGKIGIWNHDSDTLDLAKGLDPLGAMPEHPGYFVFRNYCSDMFVVAGDGRVLAPVEVDNLWQRYMQGAGAYQLAVEMEQRLFPGPVFLDEED